MNKRALTTATDGEQVDEAHEIAVTSLPSPNLVHADVFENQMQNSLHGFSSGIVALQGELEGQGRQFEAAQAELAQKHETAKADLLRRIADLEKAKRMAESAIDAAGGTK